MSSVQNYTPSSPFVGKAILNGEAKTVVSFELENLSKTTEDMGSQHHILLLDRSGSMWDDIDALIEDVKKVIKEIEDEDYITIIWFSGAGEYRTVVKLSKSSEYDAICQVLDKLKSTVGCTCFSDPISEVDSIIDETSSITDSINVTIFTDGEPVTPWSIDEEVKRIFQNLNNIKDRVIAVNTIGYGNYYNRDLLRKISDVTEYGVMTHASKIEDYSKIVSQNREMINDLIGKTVNIYAPNATIITQSKTGSKLFREKAKVRLTKLLNKVHIIYDDFSEKKSYIVNDESYTAKAKSKYSMTYLDEVLYQYAYRLAYENKREELFGVLNFIGNKRFLDEFSTSFTQEEVGEFINNLKGYAFKTTQYHSSKIARNSYYPDPDKITILDVIDFLVRNNAEYYPSQRYNRIGRKVTYTNNRFSPDTTNGEISCRMSNIVYNKDKMNISIQFIVNGTVKLSPEEARSSNLPEEIPAKIFRNHTIIKDGSLNIKKIKVKLDHYRLASKKDIKILEMISKNKDSSGKFVIDFTKLKLINQPAGMNLNDLYATELGILKYEITLKVLNYFISESDNSTESSNNGFYSEYLTEFTEDQWSALSAYGVNRSLTYTPTEKVTEESVDYYIAKEVKTYFKGFSSLPSVKKCVEKHDEGKKLTESESEIYNQYLIYKNCSINRIIEHKDNIKRDLNKLRLYVSKEKFIRSATGTLWSNGDKFEESFTYSPDNVKFSPLVITYRKVQVAI